jgi:hypothetical protein
MSALWIDVGNQPAETEERISCVHCGLYGAKTGMESYGMYRACDHMWRGISAITTNYGSPSAGKTRDKTIALNRDTRQKKLVLAHLSTNMHNERCAPQSL